MQLRKRNKLVFGIGVNDADYNVYKWDKVEGKRKIVWICPFYTTWKSMLERCYSPKQNTKFRTYIGCTVYPEWLYFSNFKGWMETQDWHGKVLDKDILFVGNKIYNPQTAVFIEQRVNLFINQNTARRGEWPIGVSWDSIKKKFAAFCHNVTTRKGKFIGLYNSPEQAHKAWLSYKLKQAKILAGEQEDERVAKALIDRYENYANYFY